MGMKWMGAVAGSAIALAASAQFVMADSAPVPGAATATAPTASTTDTRSTLDKLSDNWAVTYWGNYNGPSVGKTNQFNPNPDGTQTGAQYLDSLPTFSYLVNKDLLVGVATEFYYRPVIGQDMTLLDPVLRVQEKNVINTGPFNLKLEEWVTAPLTDPSRLANELTGLKIVENFNYTKGNLTLGVYAYERQYMYSGDSPAAAGVVEDRRFYAAPNGSYTIGKTTQATIWVDAFQYLHHRGDDSFMPSQGNYPWDIEPGVNWDITPNLSVNPYINVFPNSPTLASTYIGLILVGKAI